MDIVVMIYADILKVH